MCYVKHLYHLFRHKWFVLVAGLRLGGIPLWRLIVHDWTKFLPVEFGPYARYFHGDEAQKFDSEKAFWRAWLHHENTNPHHWGYWIPRSGKHAEEPLAMPRSYVREMVADWMGAGRTYTGTWLMGEWLTGNLPKIVPHLDFFTIGPLKHALEDAGYEFHAAQLREMYNAAEWERINNKGKTR